VKQTPLTQTWGVIATSSTAYCDLMVAPTGAKEWRWTEYDVHHDPGITVAVIERLVAEGATTLVIGTGQEGRLRVSPAARSYIRDVLPPSITVVIRQTPEAVAYYNRRILDKDARVGGVFHSTC
jgi:hypothetical protein